MTASNRRQVILNPMVNLAEGSQGSGAVGRTRLGPLDPRGGGNWMRRCCLQRSFLLRWAVMAAWRRFPSWAPPPWAFPRRRGRLSRPAQWPGPFSATTQPGTPGYRRCPGAAGFEPHHTGNRRDLFHANRANLAWKPTVPVISNLAAAAPIGTTASIRRQRRYQLAGGLCRQRTAGLRHR